MKNKLPFFHNNFFHSQKTLDSENQTSMPRQIFCFFSLARAQILWETEKENQFKDFFIKNSVPKSCLYTF